MGSSADGSGFQSSQQALLDLERSKIPPVQLLSQVGQILGVEYSSLRSVFFGPERSHHTTHTIESCAPKEEWVLRWLLKRVGLSSLAGKAKVSSEDCLHMRLDNRSWLLFLYLIHHVPSLALARILIEGEFVSNLDACLQDGEQNRGVVPAGSDDEALTMSKPSVSNKKRKRAVDDSAVQLQNDEQISAEKLPLLMAPSICAAIVRCMELCRLKPGDVSSEHLKIALAALPDIAASVSGRLTSSFVAIVTQDLPPSLDRTALMEYVTGLFGIWECRMEEGSSLSSVGGDTEFTKECLSAWLTFLRWLKSSDLAGKMDNIFRKAQRLIALHSVLPARSEFLSRHSLKNSSVEAQANDNSLFDLLSHIPPEVSPLLYDIATMSVPRHTIRRRQNEQPWLEALFSKLATLCQDGDLQQLLQVTLSAKVAIRGQLLSQMAQIQISTANPRWSLITLILQMDATVFLSESSQLMEILCEKIQTSVEEEYATIRDSIIIPLMKTAAQTRELMSFVHIWQRMLSLDIHKHESVAGGQGSRVWLDAAVFAAFTNIVKVNATPTFVHSLLGKVLENGMELDSEGKTSSSALSWTIIVSCVIICRAKDCLSDLVVLRQLREAAATAITKFRCPKSQRWRLWRLMRQIMIILPNENEPEGMLVPNASGDLSITSLKDWRDVADFSELVECFHLLVCRAVVQPEKHRDLLDQEFRCLTSILHELCTTSHRPSQLGLADACLGIILENTEILFLVPTESLWPRLWRYAAISESTTHHRIFEELVLSDTVTSNHALLSQSFQAIYDSILLDKEYQSHFAYKLLLAMPCQNIKRSKERAKLLKLLEAAGVTRYKGETHPVPAPRLDLVNPLFDEFKSRISSSNTAETRLTILEADSFERLCLELDSAKLNLTTPNQYLVDDLLSSLALLTCPESVTFEKMPHNGPSAIYQRLCSLTSVLLTRCRKRLGGRYHLLLPVLQGLLRCLFGPIPILASSKQPQIRHRQPPWLNIQGTEQLTAGSATQYARLLSSVCDPTASSVKHSRGASAGLTDDTKRAKSISGQYMQYLVMEYAQCQLQGQLLPEVKAALMPGLCAVLDAMSRDLMRGMNAAMDSSSRAIFKGLYDDYQRFGRWNQN